jgi:CRISPR-associated protein Cmr4
MMTLDPVHIGTGGYRLGRVDLSIAREPGTNVPKIPGTSLSGALRQYAAYRYGKICCAGKGDVGDESKRHCGKPTCPICYTFGYAKGEEGGYSGTVSIFDAQILLFPVHSMAGPIWVTTEERLKGYEFQISGTPTKDEEVAIVAELPKKDGKDNKFNWWNNSALNLGWLMLDAKPSAAITAYPEKSSFGNMEAWETVAHRLVMVTEKVFSQVVNSNLEVRTSVSINPLTGAAEEGALFTYEAIPRATWLIMDVVIDDYRDGTKPWNGSPVVRMARKEIKINNELKKEIIWHDNDSAMTPLYPDPNNLKQPIKINGKDKGWASASDVVRTALELAELLGIGGMGTRGFGRIRTLSNWEVKS